MAGLLVVDIVTSTPAVTYVAALALLALGGLTLVLQRRLDAAAWRRDLLSRTSELLAASGEDPAATLASVARLVVPAAADWSAIDLLDEDGTVRRVAVAHHDEGLRPAADELMERFTPRLDDETGVAAVLRSGEARLERDLSGERLGPRTRDPEHEALLQRLGTGSAVIVPLIARGRTLGSISFVSGRPNHYGAGDMEVLRELGRRCALALENARLLKGAREAEQRLEESFALLDTIFAAAPIGLSVYDRELRYVRVNERMAQINGVPVAEHLGRRPEEVIPGIRGRTEDMRRVLETGVPIIEDQVSGTTASDPGRRRDWLVSTYPVTRGEEIIGVGAVVIEITDRLAAERGLRAQTDRYEALLLALSEVGEGMVVIEGDRLVFANAAFERLVGRPLEELRALKTVWELVPEWHRAEAQRRARLRAGRDLADPHYELVVCHESGRLVDIDVAGVPLRVDDVDQLVVVVRDITARKLAEAERESALALERRARELAEAAERRMTLLASASAVFDESLDEQATLERVAELTVAEVTDTCIIALTQDSGRVRQAMAVARDPRRQELLRDFSEHWSDALEASDVFGTTMSDGRPVMVRHLAQLEGPIGTLGIDGAALVPLRARGRTFGIMGCGFVTPPPPDHEDEVLSLLEDLARRAALAIDNARLFAFRVGVARTLQRSLLPAGLPELPGAEVAASYRPAGAGNVVGGDFYDCFPTWVDNYALVIGDVCGKGAEAAALTALSRYTMRTAALHSGAPSEVLAELNEAVLRQSKDLRFATVVYATAQPSVSGYTVRIASGGHPLPYVVRHDGRVEQPGSPGTLIGVVPDPELPEHDVELGAGDVLVLYTDGVIEASPLDDAFGPEAFAAFLSGLAGRSAQEIAAAIEAAVLDVQGGGLRDDVAVLVLRVASGA